MLMRDGYAPMSSFGELLKSIKQGSSLQARAAAKTDETFESGICARDGGFTLGDLPSLPFHYVRCVSLFIHMRVFVRCRLTGVGSYRFLRSHVVLRLEFRLRTATGPCIV